MNLHLVTSDPHDAPSRYVALDAPWPPSKREPAATMSYMAWHWAGKPLQIYTHALLEAPALDIDPVEFQRNVTALSKRIETPINLTGASPT